MDRRFLPLICLVLVLAACAPNANPVEGPLTPVRLSMGYRPDIQFAPLYVAAERGYFAEAGIEIEFNHIPETTAVELVGVNDQQYAIVSGEQVLLARAQNLPIVYVLAWWQDYPVAIAYPQDGSIESIADLVGKRVGIPGLYGASYIGLRAMLDAAGIEERSLVLDSIEYTQVQSLITGREDAVVIYANNEPIQLEAQGMPVGVFRVADFVQLAANGLVTNEATIAQNPGQIAALAGAIVRGLQDVIDDPAAAFEISKRYVEGLEAADQATQLRVLEASIPFWTAERLGYSEPQAWANMHEVLLAMGLLSGPLDYERSFTNAFVP